jgi:MATE family multidrug resistance protein
MLSINIMDIVDTAMIARLGNAALAGTGFANFLFFVSFSVTVGISAGVQTLTARYLGNGQRHRCAEPLNAGLVIIGGYGLVFWALLAWLGPILLSLFSNDPTVKNLTITYFLWRIPGLMGIGWAICFRSFWNGIKRPRIYMLILLATHGVNVILNWLLIFGHWGFPEWGVKGAAAGSTIALYIGIIAYATVTWRYQSITGAVMHWPTKRMLKSVMRLGGPLAVDQWLFSIFLLAMFWVFGQMGTQASAVAHVVISCALFLFLPGLGMGMASLTLVSESLGKGNINDAKQWAWDIIMLGIPLLAITGSILVWFPKPILSVFINDPATLAMAIPPFQLDMLMMWCLCIGSICLESLVGAGATRFVMLFKVVMRYGILFPGSYILAIMTHHGLWGVWVFWAIVNTIETSILLWVWQREKWVTSDSSKPPPIA